jgi:hypothetical protein
MKGDEDISMLSQDDLKFTKILQECIHKDAKGFYEMSLPFKYQRPGLPNNLRQAEK